MFVARVLVVASASALKVRTGGVNARCGSPRDLLRTGAQEAALPVEDFGLHLLAFKNKRQERSATVRHSRQAVAAIDQLFNGKKQRIEKIEKW